MESAARNRLDVIAAVGLAVGGIFGLAGTFVGYAAARQLLWAIDGVGIVIASALLTLKYFRAGEDCVAAGFLVLLAGESLLLSGDAAGLEASVPSFAGGVALWSAALFLISAPSAFAAWIRAAAMASAILFAITAIEISIGVVLLPTSAPLPALGYPLLVLTFAGWIWTLLRSDDRLATGR
jgi:hypothetical protein